MTIPYHTIAFRSGLLLALLYALLFLAACSENPVAEEHVDSIDDFEVSLALSDDHVHTLTPVTFTVEVHDHHGGMMADFEHLGLERRFAGSDEWREIEMHREGDTFHGAYTFMSSGDYDLRVMGMLHGMDHMEMMYETEEPLHVGRAHVKSSDFRIEFENFPGHVHEGQTAAFRFWVLEEADHNAQPNAVVGLSAEIHCEDADGSEEAHAAVEVEHGVYEAEHTFAEAGETHVALHFTDADGNAVEADFHVPVAHAH